MAQGSYDMTEVDELAELDLFAEELPERLTNAATPMGSTSRLSSASIAGGYAFSLSSLCCFA